MTVNGALQVPETCYFCAAHGTTAAPNTARVPPAKTSGRGNSPPPTTSSSRPCPASFTYPPTSSRASIAAWSTRSTPPHTPPTGRRGAHRWVSASYSPKILTNVQRPQTAGMARQITNLFPDWAFPPAPPYKSAPAAP
jgi:hypothetical protein